jgi:hypothetical protein
MVVFAMKDLHAFFVLIAITQMLGFASKLKTPAPPTIERQEFAKTVMRATT